MSVPLVEQLMQSSAYPHPVDRIVLRETHISWVFLTGDWAYKIKKPRNLDFLDFSTLAARKHFCEEELRLNRRFAPGLYTAVVPVREQQGLHIGGEGEVVDYAVKMRQFDDSELLSHIAEREGLGGATVRELGCLLARTHASATALYPESGAGTPGVLQAAMEQNFSQIAPYPLSKKVRNSLAAIERWSGDRMAALMPAMIERVAKGYVKDCHGDLHLGNIARIDGALCFFDCIEFSEKFRLMDTIGEAAFLVMDCQARGMWGESWRLLNDYLEYSGDYGGLLLFDLYRCYYAMVRAKVSLLRFDSVDISPGDDTALVVSDAYRQFLQYLALAEACTQAPRKFLVITSGVSGSGKSHVAMQVLEHTGAIRLRSDVERKRLFNLAPESRSHSVIEAGIYSTEASKRTFERLQELARSVLQAGFCCIVDATFLRRAHRKPFAELAAELQIPFLILHCQAPADRLRQRIEQRNKQGNDASEADAEIMEQQLGVVEVPAEGEADAVLQVETTVSVDKLVQGIRDCLVRLDNEQA